MVLNMRPVNSRKGTNLYEVTSYCSVKNHEFQNHNTFAGKCKKYSRQRAGQNRVFSKKSAQ